MGSDLASRIKAKLLPHRRHSGPVSLASVTTNGTDSSPAKSQDVLGDEASTSPTTTAATVNHADAKSKVESKRSRHSWLSNRSSNSSGGSAARKIMKRSLSSSENEFRNRNTTDDHPSPAPVTEENHQEDGPKQFDGPAIVSKITADQQPASSNPGPLNSTCNTAATSTNTTTTFDFGQPPEKKTQPTSSSTPFPGPIPTTPALQRVVEDSSPQITITRSSTGENSDTSPKASPKHRPNPLEPETSPEHHFQNLAQTPTSTSTSNGGLNHQSDTPSSTTPVSGGAPKYPLPSRRQSLLSNRQSALIKSLLYPTQAHEVDDSETGIGGILPIDTKMVMRKVWVKRPQASATIITINEEDLVDDVRDMIIRKYSNSLGRTFDSPDLVIRIYPREQGQKERVLGPEEPMGRTLDAYFPGGQSVEEALIIDIPRRTPKASPRAPPHPAAGYYHASDDGRPSETGEGYFPPIQVGGVPSPRLPTNLPQTNGAVHSISVLGTGQIPPIPSPGGARARSYRERPERPRLGRTHTSSPNFISNGPTASLAENAASTHNQTHAIPSYPAPRRTHSRTHSHSSDQVINSIHSQTSVPMPTSPAPPEVSHPAGVATPPPRLASPRPTSNRPKRSRRNMNVEHPPSSPNILNGTVPPINVLIVEDNPINLKLLEAFVKRLKVRWSSAMNGRDALTKWRKGGFHLVLMDIQLPVMNGLEATREIRRLERVNSIGVFSSTPGGLLEEENGELKDADKLENLALFKSPVIIVALTASSLQSDRHEALAAGCNDFLTKVSWGSSATPLPVDFCLTNAV